MHSKAFKNASYEMGILDQSQALNGKKCVKSYTKQIDEISEKLKHTDITADPNMTSITIVIGGATQFTSLRKVHWSLQGSFDSFVIFKP